MRNLYHFTQNEIGVLLFKELVRLEEVDANGNYGILTQYQHKFENGGISVTGVNVEITDPIPGAPIWNV